MNQERIKCPTCGEKIRDGEVIRGIRVLRLADAATGQWEGKCSNCKTWVPLPLVSGGRSPEVELTR